MEFGRAIVAIAVAGCGGATSDPDAAPEQSGGRGGSVSGGAPQGGFASGGGSTRGGTSSGGASDAGSPSVTGGTSAQGGSLSLGGREGKIVGTADCSSFERCGGEPQGEWKIRHACWDAPSSPGKGLFTDPECSGAHTSRYRTISGSYLIENGMMELLGEQSLVTDITAGRTCIEAVTGETASEESCGAVASILTNEEQRASCAFRENAGCVCSVTSDTEPLEYSSSYEIEGAFITDDHGNTLQFCVQADELGISIPTEDGLMILTLSRAQ